MEKKEIKAKMDTVMKEAKACIKEGSPYIKGLKKKDRETPEYKEKLSKGSALMGKAMELLKEYQSLSDSLYKK